jgi:hypothetical protein
MMAWHSARGQVSKQRAIATEYNAWLQTHNAHMQQLPAKVALPLEAYHKGRLAPMLAFMQMLARRPAAPK